MQTTLTLAATWQQIEAQLDYRKRVEAFGLKALLAPYSISRPVVRVPSQRSGK